MVDDTHDLVRRLFAQLTAKLEDGAAKAADGQRRDLSTADQETLAQGLRGIADEVAMLADAIIALAGI